MAIVKIPTIPGITSYREQVTLDGLTFDLLFRFNQRDSAWYMDISDIEGNVIRHGIKLVTQFRLLRLVKDLARPPGEMVLVDPTGKDTKATFENIGSAVELIYLEEAELG